MSKKKIILKCLKYVFFFFFFLIVLLFFGGNNTDNVWNYGVSHALKMGELPYRDYNSITTPLYQFIMSIGLFINDSYLTFLVEQSILCVVFTIILEKLVGHNYLFVLSLLLFPVYYFIFPNYNFLVMLIFIYILYLEKEKKPDSVIGIFLGLLILTKHSVGGFVLIFSLFATKDIKRAFRRLLFSIMPLGIFLVYLFLTGTFFDFLDLCVFGLFDFADNNNYISYFFIVLTIICLIYTIYSFIYKKDFLNYYLLPSFTLLIPILDMFHSFYFLGFFIIVIFIREPLINSKIPISIACVILVMTFACNFYSDIKISDFVYSSNGHMKYVLVKKDEKKFISSILKKYKSYENVCMLSMYSMYFDIESDKKITYFDIPLYGNFGYDGLNKMKKKISNMHDTYFFVSDSENRQYANELNNYVRKNCIFKEKYNNMEIYYME